MIFVAKDSSNYKLNLADAAYNFLTVLVFSFNINENISSKTRSLIFSGSIIGKWTVL